MLKKPKELTIDFNEPHEFIQLWDDMTHKLQNGREAYEYPSVCYILRDEKHPCEPHRVVSKRLTKDEPQYCCVVDNREIRVRLVENKASICPPEIEGICVRVDDFWDWRQSPILDIVYRESGFPTVDDWLNNWAKEKDLEYDKEYKLWLVKVLYPHTNWQIPIKNDANKTISSE
jgi:hypothetical protein